MRLFVLIALLAFTGSAFAQKHMLDFNADAFTLGRLSFNSEKTRNSSSSEFKSLFLFLNYAQAVTDHVQAGVQLNYSRFSYDNGRSEGIEALVGGYYNLTNDFKNSIYASLHLGYGSDWTGADGFDSANKDEYIATKVAIGKRFALSESISYNPEIGFTNKNYTGGDETVWSQDFQIRFLQFAVFF